MSPTLFTRHSHNVQTMSGNTQLGHHHQLLHSPPRPPMGPMGCCLPTQCPTRQPRLTPPNTAWPAWAIITWGQPVRFHHWATMSPPPGHVYACSLSLASQLQANNTHHHTSSPSPGCLRSNVTLTVWGGLCHSICSQHNYQCHSHG